MRNKLFWLDDNQWSRISGIISDDHRFPRMIDDRRALSGIIYVLSTGCAWVDCPAIYGPHRLLLWRYRRLLRLGHWGRITAGLLEPGVEPVHVRPFRIVSGVPPGRTAH